MSADLADRFAGVVTRRSRLVVLLVVLATALVASGALLAGAGEGEIGDFRVDSPATDAADFVEENYQTEEGVTAQVVVRDREGNVLTRDSLLASLRFQRAVRADDRLGATLKNGGFRGIENVVGTAAVRESGGNETGPVSLTQQIGALEAMDEAAYESLLAAVLTPPEARNRLEAGPDPYRFLPSDYEPGATTASARLTLLTQRDDSGESGEPTAAYAAQVEIADRLDDQFADAFVVGQGVTDDASSRAVGDSFAIITPVALVLVLFVLGVTYRDPFDVLLALLGIGMVMVWVAGIMGWLAIPMNQILIAVPFLLAGLSIDYALHVVMRYREARAGTLEAETGPGQANPGGPAPAASPVTGARTAMAVGLGSVALALVAATVSTGVGFLSNVLSPLPAIRDFAVLSAGGILATFVAFGLFLPALKVETDELLEGRVGYSRDQPPFGVAVGPTNRLLGGLATAIGRVPAAVILVALLLTAGGVIGATTIDTEFNQTDFLPEDAPNWTGHLPGPLEPDTYTVRDNVEYLGSEFRAGGPGGESQLLLRGNLSDERVFSGLEAATRGGEGGETIQRRPGGGLAVTGPQTVLRELVRANRTVVVDGEETTVRAIVAERDRTGDGLPDQDLPTVYAAMFEADHEQTAAVLSRARNGTITSARVLIDVDRAASAQAIAGDTRGLGRTIESTAGIRAVATGGPVTTAVFQDALLETLVQAFSVTVLVIFLFLTALFWVRYRSLTLGGIVLAPVVASLCWLLGAMAILDIPFNSETAVITSLAIGLGVDYSIHAGERFLTERERRPTLTATLETTITGTGGTLLASAATTAGGFGVLALALSPPLQRFGIVTGTAIVFALVASLTLLPCLLVVRDRVLDRYRG